MRDKIPGEVRMAATGGPWVAVAGAVALTLAAAGCRRGPQSHGTCAGAVGHIDVSGPLVESSAYHVESTDAAGPAVLRLDCGGKLVVRVELARLRRGGAGAVALPSDDPKCFATQATATPGASGPAAPAPAVAPICGSVSGFHWRVITPKARPRLATGSFEATLDEVGRPLPGELELRFEDGTVSTIQFALDDAPVPDDGLEGVNVSLIPGRITFTGE